MGATLLSEISGQPASVWAKSPIFSRYSLVAPQRIAPSKKSSINTNRMRTTRFPIMNEPIDEHRTLPLAPKGGLKRKMAFSKQNSTLLEDSLLQSFIVRRSCKASIGHIYPCKNWLVEDVPFYVKFWRILAHPLAKRRFSNFFWWERLSRNTYSKKFT